MAATIGVQEGDTTNNGNQAVLFGPADANWNAKASYVATDVALILGYRANESLLFFGGPFYTKYNAKASIHQSAVPSTSSPAADYDISEAGINSGANIAAKFNFGSGDRYALTIEEVYSNLKWNDSVSAYDFTSSISFGFLF